MRVKKSKKAWRDGGLKALRRFQQFRLDLAPEEGARDGGGLAEGSLDKFQEKIERAVRRVEATTATMRRKVATKVPSEVRDLEKRQHGV